MKIYLLLAGMSITLNAFAQTGKNCYVNLSFHGGNHLYTGQLLKDKLAQGYGAMSVKVGWWDVNRHNGGVTHSYSAYGVGWYKGNVGDGNILGHPNALFGFISFPVFENGRSMFYIEPSLGLTFNLKPFNRIKNPINDAIGARRSVYFQFQLGGKYSLTKQLDLTYGMDITHFSNGRTFTPNLGLNMIGLSIGTSYNFRTKKSIPDTTRVPGEMEATKSALMHRSIYAVYFAMGTVQNDVDAGTDRRYLTTSSVLEYQYKLSPKHALSLGFDLFNDPSAKDLSQVKTNPGRKSLFPAVHTGYDFIIDRLTIRLQVGFHVGDRARDIKGSYFMRPAIRYEISDKLFTQLGLKTYKGARADWIEMGIGYKFYHGRN